MNKEERKPKIRFPGFEKEWEQRKLSEMAEFSKGSGYSKADIQDEGTPIILYGRLYTNYQAKISSVDTFAEEKPKSVLSKGNEVIVPASGETPEEISRASAVLKDGIILGGDLNIISPDNSIDPVFLATVLSSGRVQKELSSKAQGKAVVHLHNSDIREVTVTFPSLEEQLKINEVFDQLDETITLHQRKLDDLKELKSGLLQKMFPQKGEKVPQVRFPGFTGDWEQRKLKDIAERVTRKNTNLETTLPLTISAQYGLVDQETFFNKRVASSDISGYFLIKNGEFAYNKSTSNASPFGAIKRLDLYDKGALSTLYIVFKLNDDVSQASDFYTSYFDGNHWHKEIIEIATEGARNHGLLNVAPADFMNIEVNIPPTIEEQIEIGEFFKKVNETITLHQQKIDDLNRLKSGLLQKMFP